MQITDALSRETGMSPHRARRPRRAAVRRHQALGVGPREPGRLGADKFVNKKLIRIR
jgi:hypothetical protein